MIIDAHVHLFPRRLAEAVRAWFDTHAWNIQYREDVEAALARLLTAGIDRVVTLPYAHKPGMAVALNAFTLELAAAHPEVVPCCTVFPGEDGASRIVDEALAGPFAGIKIHSHVMKVAADDPRLAPVFEASARYRKPVVIHAGREPAVEGYGIDVHAVSGAARVRRALQQHPDAIVIIPHLGADEFAAFEQMLGEFENLYLDTAMVIGGYFPISPDIEMVRRHPGRILYGTDYPNLPYSWTRELEVVRDLRLAPEAEALVLAGNARRLFGIG
jgi:predicted TIM-barrel fold metal-dependent hydrolase